MIQGKDRLEFKYYSNVFDRRVNPSIGEKKILEKYFREEMGILTEQEIDFHSQEILLLVDIIRFSNFLS
ncbi:hypothetical protein [Aquirufa nivalisilvae]|uniref:hypothetical protein n=1 Tax=Aquirufa nivalisilvae TaxID=2516557 RepID=UPI0022A8FC3D|nr:hypothetical protein [Aquirufa nivalisilvae]MCZ2481288.1 hypothetical protein [Aquirufa nivalisilvae]